VKPAIGPLTIVLALLALMWQQQSGFNSINNRIDSQISRLRTEMSAEISGLRAEMSAEIASLRGEIASVEASLRAEIASLRAEIASVVASLRAVIAEIRNLLFEVVERLSRIEGFLGLWMPAEAAARAPGASLAGSATQQSSP